MTFKTTKKQTMAIYRKTISISYCALQHLLARRNHIAHTEGVYGWNANIYDVGNGVAIVTGYRPFGNISPDYDLVREYDKRARELIYDYSLSYEEQKKALDDLINEFIKEVTK
jgi:chorismate mutase